MKKKNKKYFICSDIHSFYKPLRKALKEAGWNKKNKNHILVVLGDVFDRGPDTLKVYEFLKSIPEDQIVLVKGNHEDLFLELLTKSVPDDYDYSNGTVRTFCSIAGINERDIDRREIFLDYIMSRDDVDEIDYAEINAEVDKKCRELFYDVREKVEKSGVVDWLRSGQWQNYFELDDYVMVHSFVPLRLREEEGVFYGKDYFPSWRYDSSEEEWYKARWGCPFTQYDQGYFKEDKTLVCGHWHAYGFREHYLNIKYEGQDIYGNPDIHKTYKGKGIIALDACTVVSDIVNVLVIEE